MSNNDNTLALSFVHIVLFFLSPSTPRQLTSGWLLNRSFSCSFILLIFTSFAISGEKAFFILLPSSISLSLRSVVTSPASLFPGTCTNLGWLCFHLNPSTLPVFKVEAEVMSSEYVLSSILVLIHWPSLPWPELKSFWDAPGFIVRVKQLNFKIFHRRGKKGNIYFLYFLSMA